MSHWSVLFACTADFTLNGNMLSFNSSTSSEEVCLTFSPSDDGLIEDNEVFNFMTTTLNPLDYFTNDSMFYLTIYDEDGE